MTDLTTRLTHARPTDADLDALWAPADREAVLARVLAADARRHVGPRRIAAGTAVAALVGAAFVPTLLGSQSAAAADLHALAVAAAAGPVARPGQWQHVVTTSRQVDRDPDAIYTDVRESWTSYDGRTTYLVDRNTSTGHPPRTEHDVLTGDSPASYQDPTPAFAATLPDTAEGLLAYLDPRVFGSSSHAEAMFEALTQLAGSHTLPPRTLAAAFDALATIDHVTTDDVHVAGRSAVEIRYDESPTHSNETYVFDRATGQGLSLEQDSDRSDYQETTTLSNVVDVVPPPVLAAFRARAH